MAASTLITDTSKEATLNWFACIQYPIQFCRKNDKAKNKDKRALIDSLSKINTIHPAYATKLGLCTKKINIGVQKIDRFYLDTIGMVIVDCLVKNKLGRV